jgi:dihydropteroate synthase
MNRILCIDSIDDAKQELNKIKVSSQGVVVMAPKALGANIKLTNVKVGAANILKQEMLSIGGDAAVARGVVNGTELVSDMVILGNADKIQKLIKKLGNQTIFGLPEIRNDLQIFFRILTDKNELSINCRGKEFVLDSTKIMGILNVTPDSFSDGNKFVDSEEAVSKAFQMIEAGADIIDIGGESTRPGAVSVSADVELKRVIPVIKAVRAKSDVIISIDTSKAEVADAALAAGANIINDISSLRADVEMISILKKYEDVPIILMHMQGTPRNMQKDPHYNDVIDELMNFFNERIEFCKSNGISQNRIIIDPGIGFGKRFEDNLMILKKIKEFRSFGVPVLLGASRKSFLSKIYDSKPEERLSGSLATTALAHANSVGFVRAHDVKEHKQLLQTLDAIRQAK